MVKDFNIPTIYVISKVHKSLCKPPGRPKISANGGPLEGIGQFLDALIGGMVKELPFFIQDTRDVLQKIRGGGARGLNAGQHWCWVPLHLHHPRMWHLCCSPSPRRKIFHHGLQKCIHLRPALTHNYFQGCTTINLEVPPWGHLPMPAFIFAGGRRVTSMCHRCIYIMYSLFF